MLTSTLRTFVKNSIKEIFYGKKKINVLTHFFIFHKSDVKTFLKWIVRALVSMTLKNREMLTSALRAFIKNPIKESFYGKRKKNNILTHFFICHKSDVKTFLKLIVNKYPKGTR